ncbi:MAG: YraN family protein [Phycisphaerae bacterium]
MNFASIKRRLNDLSLPFRPSDQRQRLGRRGERLVARYLQRRRHKILARNYRCDMGEIDLISADGDTIVFVEIKTRSSRELQDPQETIGSAKWRRVERAARHFLASCDGAGHPCRFDFVSVVWPPHGSPEIEHVEDAFQPRRS